MKKHNTLWLLLLALCSIFASCKKDKTTEDQLPPATQTGAGTFGCKINGKVYIPKGNSGTGKPNPHIQYDLDLNGQPYLSIETNRFSESSSTGGVLVIFRNLSTTGYYPININLKYTLGWPEVITNCGGQSIDTTVKAYGGGAITKLDILNHIISGTFDFKYKALQCDTIFISDGRFDIKF